MNRIAMTAAMVAVTAGGALAQPITGSTTPQVFDITGIPDFTDTFNVNQFDASIFASALGPGFAPIDITLVSVEITLDISVTGGLLEFDNDGVEGGTVQASFGVLSELSSGAISFPAGFDVSANPFVSDMFTLSGQTDNGGADGPTFDGGQAGDTDFGSLDGAALSDNAMALITQAFFVDQFAGTGTIPFDVATSTFVEFTGVSGLSSSTSPANVEGTLTVVYNYSAVPTPGIASIAGVGLLAGLRRRR
ncbi:MAG: hypothetical protein AAGI17_01195 [Planctomycetota bacterium]